MTLILDDAFKQQLKYRGADISYNEKVLESRWFIIDIDANYEDILSACAQQHATATNGMALSVEENGEGSKALIKVAGCDDTFLNQSWIALADVYDWETKDSMIWPV